MVGLLLTLVVGVLNDMKIALVSTKEVYFNGKRKIKTTKNVILCLSLKTLKVIVIEFSQQEMQTLIMYGIEIDESDDYDNDFNVNKFETAS